MDYFQFFDVVAGNLYPKLIDFNLGGNQISGVIGNLLTVFPALSKIDISDNLFSGPIDAIPRSTTVNSKNEKQNQIKKKKEEILIF